MASQGRFEYSTPRSDPNDMLRDREWREPGCTAMCRRVRATVLGDTQTRVLTLHDALSHEDYGIGLGARGAYRGNVVQTGGLTIDPKRCQVFVNGSERLPSSLEMRTLLYLAEHLDETIECSRLIHAVWGDVDVLGDSQGTYGFLRSHMFRVRRRIFPCHDLILTVVGTGYRLRDVEPTSAYNAAAQPFRWSRFYDACVECGTTERPYANHGRCSACYWKWCAAQGRKK